nr:MAG TPA: protein of unknown function (DUF5437) [Caudoviricetes sp.]
MKLFWILLDIVTIVLDVAVIVMILKSRKRD